jgi:hypothetical protein
MFMSVAMYMGEQQNAQNAQKAREEAELNNRRETYKENKKLLALYGDALIGTLFVADSLYNVAKGLQSVINRLAESDAAMGS